MSFLPLALLLAAQTPTAQVVAIPDAKIQMVVAAPMSPKVVDDFDLKQATERTGCITHQVWWSEFAGCLFTLTYFLFMEGKPPLVTPQQQAANMWDMGQRLKEMYKDDPEMNDKFERKFRNRVVSQRKLGVFDAWLDVHNDEATGSLRKYLAWGTVREHWVVEAIGKNSEKTSKLMDLVFDSIQVGEVPAKVLDETKLTPQKVPGMEVGISAPAVFMMFARPAASSSRPGGKGLNAHLNLGFDGNIFLAQDKYDDKVVTDTQARSERFLKAMDMPGYEIKAAKIVPHTVGSLQGHLLRMEYVGEGTPMYGLSLSLTKPGLDLVVHINFSKARGGKARADAVFATLRPSG